MTRLVRYEQRIAPVHQVQPAGLPAVGRDDGRAFATPAARAAARRVDLTSAQLELRARRGRIALADVLEWDGDSPQESERAAGGLDPVAARLRTTVQWSAHGVEEVPALLLHAVFASWCAMHPGTRGLRVVRHSGAGMVASWVPDAADLSASGLWERVGRSPSDEAPGDLVIHDFTGTVTDQAEVALDGAAVAVCLGRPVVAVVPGAQADVLSVTVAVQAIVTVVLGAAEDVARGSELLDQITRRARG